LRYIRWAQLLFNFYSFSYKQEEITRSFSGSISEEFSSASQPLQGNQDHTLKEVCDHGNKDDLYLVSDNCFTSENTPREITDITINNTERCNLNSTITLEESAVIKNVNLKKKCTCIGVQNCENPIYTGTGISNEEKTTLESNDASFKDFDLGCSAQTATYGEGSRVKVFSDCRVTAAQEAKALFKDSQVC